jgi:hypothetical protein
MVRQERIALLILCGVGAAVFIGGLVLEGIGKGAFAEKYGSASGDGTLVTFEGRIDNITTTKTGGHSVLSISGTKVFLPETITRSVKLSKGDRIRIYGIVQTYQNEREILISSPGDIVVIP